VHARGDPLIPAQHSVRLHARAAEPRALWIAETSGHGMALLEAPDAYLAEVRRFFLAAP
jgi:pimeloyl-ACP methyl ester carboxylesterase